jgi:hypothetical protein
MYEKGLQILIIVVMVMLIVYLIKNIFNIEIAREGFTDNDGTSINTTNIDTINAAIQANIVKLDDELMLRKFKKQYETVIINLDDYINLLMMKQIINIKYDSGIQTTIDYLENLNTLKTSKDSLNVAMKHLDKL